MISAQYKMIEDGADRQNLTFKDINWSEVNRYLKDEQQKAWEEEYPPDHPFMQLYGRNKRR
jgi:hypothetical protein